MTWSRQHVGVTHVSIFFFFADRHTPYLDLISLHHLVIPLWCNIRLVLPESLCLVHTYYWCCSADNSRCSEAKHIQLFCWHRCLKCKVLGNKDCMIWWIRKGQNPNANRGRGGDVRAIVRLGFCRYFVQNYPLYIKLEERSHYRNRLGWSREHGKKESGFLV